MIQITYPLQLVPVTRIEFLRNGQVFGSWIGKKTSGGIRRQCDTVTHQDTAGTTGMLPAQPGLCQHVCDTVTHQVTAGRAWTPLCWTRCRCAGHDAIESAGTPSGWQGCSRVSWNAVGSAGTPSGWPRYRWHSQDAVVPAKMQSGQLGRHPAGRDTAGIARTPLFWPKCRRVSRDAIRLAGTPLA